MRDQAISPVLSSAELAGLLNQYAEFYFVDDDGGEFKPLPPVYGNTWLNHAGERGRLVGVLADHPQGIWTAAELTDLAAQHFLLRTELGEGSPRSQTTKLGVLAGRYVDERFDLGEERIAVFRRSDDGRKTLYSVGVIEKVADV